VSLCIGGSPFAIRALNWCAVLNPSLMLSSQAGILHLPAVRPRLRLTVSGNRRFGFNNGATTPDGLYQVILE
jgi:hypothetical protein